MPEPIKNFGELFDRVRANVASHGPIRVGLLGADETRYLSAVLRARDQGIITPVLIGPRREIETSAQAGGYGIDGCELIEAQTAAQIVSAAMKAADGGQVSLLARGRISARVMLSSLFDQSTGFRVGRNLVSHVAVFEIPAYPRLLLMSDAAVNVAPDLKKKIDIIGTTVRVANRLGIDKPRVAILAAVEVIYPGMRVTEEGAILSKMADRGQIPGCLVDGPLSMDVAVLPEVAAQKGARSEVAGRADILIAPNIETGNGLYKAMALFVKAKTGGVIMGGRFPVAVSSRCDHEDGISCSLLLGALMASTGK